MKKKPILLALATTGLMFLSCAENVEKSAQRFLNAAEEALAAGQFGEAKTQIDSVKIVYPKAFEARRAGIELMRRVELAEAEQTYAYTDSLLTVNTALAEELIPKFAFEKDTDYQEVGNYLAPSQQIEKNLTRSYLRATVDEKGRMTLTSQWRGASYIHHRAVKVSAGGTYAQTPEAENPYESYDAMAKTERNDYVLGEDGGVIEFIALHSGEAVKVEFLGEKTTSTTTLTRADTKAVADVLELARVLKTISELDAMQDETSRKIAFLHDHEKQAENN